MAEYVAQLEDVDALILDRVLAEPGAVARIHISYKYEPRTLKVRRLGHGSTIEIVFNSRPGSDETAATWSMSFFGVDATYSWISFAISRNRRVAINGLSRAGYGHLVARRTETSFLAPFELERLDLEVAGLTGAYLGGNNVVVNRGVCRAFTDDEYVEVRYAREVSVKGHHTSLPVRLVDVRESQLTDIRITVPRRGAAIDCMGDITLEECRGRVDGRGKQARNHTRDASLSVAIAPKQGSDGPFEGAGLSDFELDGRTLDELLNHADDLRSLDPTPASIPTALKLVNRDERARIAEQLHDQLSLKSQRPRTVDAAGREVLRARRAGLDARRIDWWLLSIYGLVGYGRSIRRPLMLFVAFVTMVLTYRIALAFHRDAGFLHSGDGLAISWSWPAVRRAGDVFLTVVLLPVTFATKNSSPANTVGLSGGYLVAARVILGLPAVVVLAAARRYLRVKPTPER